MRLLTRTVLERGAGVVVEEEDIEKVRVDPSLPGSVLDLYHMPWTHSLPAALVWSLAAAGLARLAKAPLRRAEISAPGKIAALAADGPDGLEIWLANLTAATQTLELPSQARRATILDAEHFAAATRDPEFLDTMQPANGPLELSAFAIARLRG